MWHWPWRASPPGGWDQWVRCSLGGVERAIQIPDARRKEALKLYEQVKVDTERLHQQDDPKDLTLRHDHAILLARQAIALPEGDREAIPLLEQAVKLIKEGGKDSVFLAAI